MQENQWTEEDFDASRPVAPYIGRFVRRCWEARGRAVRCRKARAAYPNPNLPFLKVCAGPAVLTGCGFLVIASKKNKQN